MHEILATPFGLIYLLMLHSIDGSCMLKIAFEKSMAVIWSVSVVKYTVAILSFLRNIQFYFSVLIISPYFKVATCSPIYSDATSKHILYGMKNCGYYQAVRPLQ